MITVTPAYDPQTSTWYADEVDPPGTRVPDFPTLGQMLDHLPNGSVVVGFSRGGVIAISNYVEKRKRPPCWSVTASMKRREPTTPIKKRLPTPRPANPDRRQHRIVPAELRVRFEWTAERVDEMMLKRESGMSFNQIGADFGINRNSVLVKHGRVARARELVE